MRAIRSAIGLQLGLGFAAAALFCAGCEDRQVAVFSVEGLPDKVTSLGIYSHLNSAPLVPGEARQNVQQFGIELPIDTTGTIAAQVFAYPSDVPCVLAQGAGSVEMPGKYRQNTTVTMTPVLGGCKTALEPVDFPSNPVVYATAANNIWIAGAGAKIVHWNGAYYEKVKLPDELVVSSPTWSGVFAWSADDVWFVGNNKSVAHYLNGTLTAVQTEWGLNPTFFPDPGSNNWRAITGGDPMTKDLFMVGDLGVYGYLASGASTVKRYVPSCYGAPPPATLFNAVSCFVSGSLAAGNYFYDCWVAGNTGTLFRFDTSHGLAYSCSGQASPALTPMNLTGVWVSANLVAKRFEVRAVGTGSTILRGTATYQPPMALPAVDFTSGNYQGHLDQNTVGDYTGISGTGVDNVWVAGTQGKLLRWLDTDIDPGATKPFILTSTGLSDDLTSISALAPGTMFSTTKAFSYAGSLF